MRSWLAAALASGLVLAGCTAGVDAGPEPLRRAAGERVRIGTAVEGVHSSRALAEPEYREALAANFNSVTPENQMKWSIVHPAPHRWVFEPADEVVGFAREHGQTVRGHTLLWHGSLPAWVGDLPDCAALRAAVRDHVTTLVTRYRGIVTQWDVVNEMYDETGRLRPEEPFASRCGEGLVADAFRWAHAADPQATLFLNDYAAEAVNARSDAYHALARRLLAQGVPLGGMGFQGHLRLADGVPATMDENLARFAALGLEVAVTEADVRRSVTHGLPWDAERQAAVHARLLDACLRQAACRSFTLWGFTDRYSWVPGALEGQGAATVMDADYAPKPALLALARRLREG